MIVGDIHELELFQVADRGVPNLERIALFVKETTNMGQFGIMIGYSSQDKSALPYQDNLFWFGNGVVTKGDWLILYTGKGTPKTEKWEPTGSNVYSVHWGRNSTIFANSYIVPILFRVDAVSVGLPPSDLPQIESSHA